MKKKVIVLNKQFERERERKKERSRRMSNKLFAYNYVQYLDVFILNLDIIKIEIIVERRERETY